MTDFIFSVTVHLLFVKLLNHNQPIMNKRIPLCLLVFVLSITTTVFAQPGCPSVNAGQDVNLPCGQTCANLYASPFNAGNTTNYDVSQIPYTPFPYNVGTPILVNIDDTWSSAISLPFTFCFFGQPYTELKVGSNGLISFDNAITAGSFCEWDITNSGSLPSTGLYTNSIMGPYHDIDPSLGGDLRYQILGAAPCRIFVISYSSVPLYNLANCPNNGAQTHQIVLYETTNAIEIYIENKEICTNWNDGLAIEGIQDATGTVAFTVPGRNSGTWSAQNDAWRFTPNGPSIVQVNWYEGPTLLGSGNSINVCPSAGTTYTAEAVYLPCNGGTPVSVTDDVFVGFSAGLTAQIDSFRPVSCNTTNTGAAFASYNSSSAVLAYGWIPGPQNTTSITNVAAGTYVFFVLNADSCMVTDTVEILEGLPFSVTVNDSSFFDCLPPGNDGVLGANPNGGLSPFTYAWSNTQTGQYATGLTSGTYTVTVTDAANCTGTDAGVVSYQIVQASFGAVQTQDVGCTGNDGAIVVTTNNTTQPVSYTWSPTLPDNDTVVGLTPGTYNVTATDANGCSATASYNVIADPNGLSVVITATPLLCNGGNNGSATANPSGGSGPYTYVWSTQETTQTINNLPAGIVLVTVTDNDLCVATASLILNQANAISYNSQINQPNCASLGFGTELLTPRNTVGSVIINVAGIGSDTLSMVGGDTTAVFPNVPTGNYTFDLTDSLGCTISGSFFVLAGAAGETFTVESDSVNCFGTSDGAINITANSTNRPYQYSLNGGQFQADSVFTNLTAGTYTIVTLNSFNCLDTLTAIIGQPDAVVVNASPDTIFTTVGAANAITVTTQNFNSATYNWTPSSGLSCSDCNNPSATVEAPTNYVVVVSEANNPLCFGSDSVVILLGGKVAMPNAFSPNGDGRNDLFFPRAQVGEAEVKAFRIYNRWGELVHDDVTPWNGTFKNTDQPAGTYIYYVTYVEQKPTNPNVKVDTSVQGSFTLLR